MKILLLSSLALALPTAPAEASPVVDLTCPIAATDGGSATTLEITLNQGLGTATYRVSTTGGVLTGPAEFTPYIVAIRNKDFLKIIERRTGRIVDGTTLSGEFVISREGVCEVLKLTNRKF